MRRRQRHPRQHDSPPPNTEPAGTADQNQHPARRNAQPPRTTATAIMTPPAMIISGLATAMDRNPFHRPSAGPLPSGGRLLVRSTTPDNAKSIAPTSDQRSPLASRCDDANATPVSTAPACPPPASTATRPLYARSEERRVGKEC